MNMDEFLKGLGKPNKYKAAGYACMAIAQECERQLAKWRALG